MEFGLENLEKLDLKQLRQLVALKENSKELTRLEGRRQRLKRELETTEHEIREFLGKYPEVREILAASGSISGRRLTPSGRRPRGWIQDQVLEVLRRSRQPLPRMLLSGAAQRQIPVPPAFCRPRVARRRSS